MTSKIIWGIIMGLVIGAAFGHGGDTPTAIAGGIAAGAILAGIWHYLSR